ncbi:MAG TPA: hypothetical protein VIS74_03545 [Chthoniobacterales bacterium]
MENAEQADDTLPSQGKVFRAILKVAWLAVLLGLGVEAILLAAKVSLGIDTAAGRFAADVVGKITWSVLICIGLAVGIIVTRTAALPMLLFGLISAPIATILARVTHKSILEAMNLAAPGTLAGTLAVSAIRAVEYGLLGLALCLLVRKSVQSPWAYAGTGFGLGLIFGLMVQGTYVWLTKAPLSPPETMARLVNEIIFPIGCSLVLYVSVAIGKSKADSLEIGSHSG